MAESSLDTLGMAEMEADLTPALADLAVEPGMLDRERMWPTRRVVGGGLWYCDQPATLMKESSLSDAVGPERAGPNSSNRRFACSETRCQSDLVDNRAAAAGNVFDLKQQQQSTMAWRT